MEYSCDRSGKAISGSTRIALNKFNKFKWTLLSLRQLLPDLAYKFVADAQIAGNEAIGQALMMRIFLNEIKVTLVCSFTEIIDHSSLQSNVCLLCHDPEKLFDFRVMLIGKFLISFTDETHFAVFQRFYR